MLFIHYQSRSFKAPVTKTGETVILFKTRQIMESCRTLKEYSIYVERVRKYRAVMPIEQAVEKAVTECIRENILADFLKKQRAEVIAMSILEYNEEEEIKKIRASERRGGYDDGWNAGRIEGEAAGRIEGEAAGKIAGRIEGEAVGKIAGKKEVLLEILEEKGEISEALSKKIQNQNDMTTLKSWIQKACMIDSIEEFENDI